ncbi:MAG: hypothetical protein OHK93_005053 [Ramalina farinacea]|uniref:FAR-17a/AIG1-like protein n=1 Tax=Ramalina farinacea TaxID=258253 RepID=A0AA43QZT4_9LECA|nr:hypothetical protein [Ramalina farinacea]
MSLIFHAGALAQHIYALNALLHWPVPFPEPVPTSWHFNYLTTLALSLSIISFSLACLTHLFTYITKPRIPSSPLLNLLCKIHETISPVAAAGEILITILYFGLKVISNDLVIPDWVKLPLTLDLNLHLVPTILRLVDALLFSPPRQWQAVSVQRAAGVSLSAAVAYWVVCERSKATSGMYPYPVMEEVGGVGGRLVLWSVSAGLLMGSMLGLKWMYGIIYGSEEGAKDD